MINRNKVNTKTEAKHIVVISVIVSYDQYFTAY
jgi:hypothetical protein